jgi:hypothetical protein
VGGLGRKPRRSVINPMTRAIELAEIGGDSTITTRLMPRLRAAAREFGLEGLVSPQRPRRVRIEIESTLVGRAHAYNILVRSASAWHSI